MDCRTEQSHQPVELDSISSCTELFFIENGSDINAKYMDSETALHKAVGWYDKKIVLLLLNLDVDVNIKNKNGHTVLQVILQDSFIYCTPDWSDVIMILLDKGADMFTTDEFQHTLLHYAAGRGNILLTTYLLDHNIDVNSTNCSGQTPLCYIFYFKERYLTSAHENDDQNHLLVAELLLKRKANVNLRDNSGMTPFLNLVTKSSELVKLLIDYEAEISARNNKGECALHIVLLESKPCIETVKILLAKGLDINTKDIFNKTPFYMVRALGNQLMMELLVDNGADLQSVDSKGLTVFTDLIQEIKKNHKKSYYPQNMVDTMEPNQTNLLIFLLKHKDVIKEINSEEGNTILRDLPEHAWKIILENLIMWAMGRGVGISSHNKFTMVCHCPMTEHYYKCIAELQEAEKTVLYGTVSYYSILLGNKKDLIKYGQCKKLVDAFSKQECMEKFPMYAKYIIPQFERGRNYQPSIEDVNYELKHYRYTTYLAMK